MGKWAAQTRPILSQASLPTLWPQCRTTWLHRSSGGAEMNKNTSSKMTRKEALAVLHKAYDAVGWSLFSENATEEAKALREQVPDAFRVFDVALYGEQARLRATGGLCHICYLRMSMSQPL